MSARESLLASARALLRERGYESTSPGEIQRRAGVGQGSFYHHFGGKLDLAAQALDATSREWIEAFERTLGAEAVGRASGTDALERIEAFLNLERDAPGGCPLGRHASESSIAEPRLREPVRAYFEHVERGLGRLLHALERDGRLADGVDAGDVAQALVAAVQGGFVLARAHGEPERMRAALRGAHQMLLAVVRTDD